MRPKHPGRSAAIPTVALLAAIAVALAPEKPARAQLVVMDPVNLVQNIVSAIQSITEVAQQVQQLTNEASSDR